MVCRSWRSQTLSRRVDLREELVSCEARHIRDTRGIFCDRALTARAEEDEAVHIARDTRLFVWYPDR